MQQDTKLELHIEYIVEEGKVIVISCKGYGAILDLPADIKGLAVTQIGAYAFSDVEKSREVVAKSSEIQTEVIPGVRIPGMNAEYIHGRKLKEVSLPPTLEIVDEYAFYNCRELEVLHMWGGRVQIENGAFMNCEMLKVINMKASATDITCVSGILSEQSGELCITFSSKGETGVFMFPEFYEDSLENTPARVFHYLIYGAGYRYRQCFEQGRLNVMAYDMVFQSAEIQNIDETALHIAFLRLQYPYQLQESMKKKYLQYISLHLGIAISLIIRQDNLKELIFLTELEIMTEKHYKTASEEAVLAGRKECAGILLKKKLYYYPPKEKKFEL